MTALLKQVQREEQDYEWYPTTEEIILKVFEDAEPRLDVNAVLDVGAGDGKVLGRFADDFDPDKLYAIERSPILIKHMPKDVIVIGTDFHEQSFYDKTVDITFCNPPYSEFIPWTEKLIRESACSILYLVIPARWEASHLIQDALDFREVEAVRIFETDFLEAEDRKARARVEVLRVDFQKTTKGAFESFFQELYPELTDVVPDTSDKQIKEARNELIGGKDYVDNMVALYRSELATLQ